MKYLRLLLCLLLLPACQAEKDTMEEDSLMISPSDRKIRIVGRYDDADQEAIRFAWTGSEIQARFKGSFIGIFLTNEGANGPGYYQVWIDDSSFVLRVDENTQAHQLANELTDDWHHLRVFKRTEAETGTGVFRGLLLPPQGELGDLPAPSGRKMLVIGNSITCGYGNEGDNRDCGFTPETENGFETYAQLTAEALDAQLHAICWSGRGMYQNYDQSRAGSMPELFKLLIPNEPDIEWNPTRYFPDLILINLGTNDFAHGAPDLEAFLLEYRLFVQRLRIFSPNSEIVLLTGSMMSGTSLSLLQDQLDRVLAYRAAAGDTRVNRFDLSTQGALGYGCDWHPNVAQQRKNAAELTDFVRQLMQW